MCIHTYGWLSKLWAPFWVPKYLVPYYKRDPKRDHRFDTHPVRFGCRFEGFARLGSSERSLMHAGFQDLGARRSGISSLLGGGIADNGSADIQFVA